MTSPPRTNVPGPASGGRGGDRRLRPWIAPALLLSVGILAAGWLLPRRAYPLPWFPPVEGTITVGVCEVIVLVGALDVRARRSTRALPMVGLSVVVAVVAVARTVTFPGVVPGGGFDDGRATAWLFAAKQAILLAGLLGAVTVRPRHSDTPSRALLRTIAASLVAGVITVVIAVRLASLLPAIMTRSGEATGLQAPLVLLGILPAVALLRLAGRSRDPMAPAIMAAGIPLALSGLIGVAATSSQDRYAPLWYALHVLFIETMGILLTGQVGLFWESLQAEKRASQESARRVHHLTMLQRVAHVVSTTVDSATWGRLLVRAAVVVASPPGRGPAQVALFRIERDVAILVEDYDESGETAVGACFPLATEPHLARAVAAGEVVSGSIDLAATDPDVARRLRRLGASCGAWAPIHVDGDVVALLSLVTREPHIFSTDALDNLGAVARLAGLALANIRNLEGQRRMVERLHTLVEANLALARCTADLSAVLREAADAARALTGAGRALVALATPDGLRLERVATSPPQTGTAGSGACAHAAALLRGRSAPYVLSDLPADDRAGAALRAAGVRTLLAVPMAVRGDTIGTLCVEDRQDETGADFSAEDREALGILAAHVAVAVDNARSIRRLTDGALIDPLTGLRNRLAFDRFLSQRPAAAFAVLAIDVDDLKVINDEAGHEAGDAVLRAVAHAITQTVGAEDAVHRTGGDEFAVTLADSDREGARAVAGRLHRVLDGLPVPHGQARISIGIATGEPGEEMATVWGRADAALFGGKRGGRERVVVWDGGDPAMDHPTWLGVLDRILAGSGLTAVFQPIVTLDARRSPVAFEALARPRGLGPRSSVEGLFVTAQRYGLMRDLDWRCRRVALEDARVIGDATLFLNISAGALIDPVHDVDQMILVLASAGRDPHGVVLEITERELVHDLHRVALVTSRYREAGFRFAVDDVGDGRSTFAMMLAVRPEFIKIASALVRESHLPQNAGFIEAGVAFTRRLGGHVIAEGVETEEQAERVAALGVSLGQGYLFSHPLPAAEAAALVSSSAVAPAHP